jgi:hypothetical protein
MTFDSTFVCSDWGRRRSLPRYMTSQSISERGICRKRRWSANNHNATSSKRTLLQTASHQHWSPTRWRHPFVRTTECSKKYVPSRMHKAYFARAQTDSSAYLCSLLRIILVKNFNINSKIMYTLNLLDTTHQLRTVAMFITSTYNTAATQQSPCCLSHV